MGLDRPLRLQEVVTPKISRQLEQEDVRLHASCLNTPPGDIPGRG